MCKCLLLFLACFLPPIAILLYEGCTANMCINILLTCLGGIPGIIHAWYVILCMEPKTVTNVYVQQGVQPPPAYHA
ncbi:unnamed protein product [Caenorhabditis bovis]|uniref:YqaE/Pmp3 family membrane protein n=1 Tax=Caenorhabditis bovis TaxID=2654633 RepID=A0A8S1EKB6_9PELO|nr:unnamed protein product [Caenorhabditis bovis]